MLRKHMFLGLGLSLTIGACFSPQPTGDSTLDASVPIPPPVTRSGCQPKGTAVGGLDEVQGGTQGVRPIEFQLEEIPAKDDFGPCEDVELTQINISGSGPASPAFAYLIVRNGNGVTITPVTKPSAASTQPTTVNPPYAITTSSRAQRFSVISDIDAEAVSGEAATLEISEIKVIGRTSGASATVPLTNVSRTITIK